MSEFEGHPRWLTLWIGGNGICPWHGRLFSQLQTNYCRIFERMGNSYVYM